MCLVNTVSFPETCSHGEQIFEIFSGGENPIARNYNAVDNISHFLKGDVFYPWLFVIQQYQSNDSLTKRCDDHGVSREEQLVHGGQVLPVLGEVGGVVLLPEVPDPYLAGVGSHGLQCKEHDHCHPHMVGGVCIRTKTSTTVTHQHIVCQGERADC